ncbi:MAG: tRNA guanosine(34) transglycosylase Tgt [Bacteroidia bacterium]|nr:tRNA guanosine(34) transglycosylase Tgt [Bacteroidia bacterium]MDW8133977.1 tRNA guanosine(34) transglycosylase Tgt [Bacteroidia bacterium]
MDSSIGYALVASTGAARAGILRTAWGEIETPTFMPVATHGSIKAFPHHLLQNVFLILANAYHLYLRPGVITLEEAGGLHAFMGWKGAILTDSGGYQIFSLAKQRRLSEEGVLFKSHIDGSSHLLTPEDMVDIQRKIGSDIQMVLDVCPPYPCSIKEMEEALSLTHLWAVRARKAFLQNPTAYGRPVQQFGIIQGGVDAELRKACWNSLKDLDFEGWAVGGLAVGEPFELRRPILHLMGALLPPEKPRYVMGLGTPIDILEAIAAGMDMMDCVLPTRNARHGLLYSWEGIRNIKNSIYWNDFTPIPPWGYTRAYLHHLFRVEDPLALTLATSINLAFFMELVQEARKRIIDGTFYAWMRDTTPLLMQKHRQSNP